jgi:hypothetical protein
MYKYKMRRFSGKYSISVRDDRISSWSPISLSVIIDQRKKKDFFFLFVI